ncbi:UbiH 2-polyprenyl-6-methoxyphenol hydroxylase [Pyrenophora tritici-repentis]|uniref:Monooxygenase n=2 Tax=Pyrenophora tritici-repentis TaxID=45151 RepID=A0A2W1HEG1_9PLEO|nr:monooxygenase [Pyrenophora tritici-repentis Pt-1C-BFP]KAA8617632.1 monooxygenase protein [Pyrenophora tritici-repentis]EDU42558.1 monoxygenase [Pyrenophora tritici-repentis Pt-1C-BFP]KAF7443384.1 monooxygenase [Pyrenophora tritici-repentis]KAG9376934.1 monooxygenase [Pyrenophora tritici-repentis]KAI0574220.1 monooxygenase protein [Pyrenophora tritici-repentis]
MASQLTDQKPKTGIRVLIVGGGFGGLALAIECHRQGHTPIIYEAHPQHKNLGDTLMFGPNGGRIIHRWSNGAVAAAMSRISLNVRDTGFNVRKYDTGEIIVNQKSNYRPDSPMFNGHRGELHEILLGYVKELGVEIHLGQRVETFWEEAGSAGVVLGDGSRHEGDVVVACDGVRSKARKYVLGYEHPLKSSGFSTYRTWFDADEMMKDPETRPFVENGDTSNGWIGPNSHFLFWTLKGGKACCWVMTHRTDGSTAEPSSTPGYMKDVKEHVQGWDPLVWKIVSKTPEEKLSDWKLLYCDPLPSWVSGKHGRVCLLGDSAHPFLPTSAQGASQAMEDAVTLAVVLRQAGKGNVRAALRAYQDIRYDRVKAVQKTGEDKRDAWHEADWDEVRKDPTKVTWRYAGWILSHDAEKHAEEVGYDAIKKASLVRANL